MKKLMFTLSMVSGTFCATTTSSYAQDAAQLKEFSMQACAAQAAQVEESLRENLIKICECTVENTDFDTLIKKSAAGDTSFQADAQAVVQQCQQDNS